MTARVSLAVASAAYASHSVSNWPFACRAAASRIRILWRVSFRLKRNLVQRSWAESQLSFVNVYRVRPAMPIPTRPASADDSKTAQVCRRFRW